MPELDPHDARIADLEAKVESLTKALEKALARITALEAENAELRVRLGQNSQNSSKPPSSDPPGTQREPKAPTGRARGGQPGHKGHKRDRLPADRMVPGSRLGAVAVSVRSAEETPTHGSTRSSNCPRSAPT